LEKPCGNGRSWSFEVGEKTDDESGRLELQGWDVGVSDRHRECRVGRSLKDDIERAELSVFGKSATSWLLQLEISVSSFTEKIAYRSSSRRCWVRLRDRYFGELTILPELAPEADMFIRIE
jgi:hypothetical protein